MSRHFNLRSTKMLCRHCFDDRRNYGWPSLFIPMEARAQAAVDDVTRCYGLLEEAAAAPIHSPARHHIAIALKKIRHCGKDHLFRTTGDVSCPYRSFAVLALGDSYGHASSYPKCLTRNQPFLKDPAAISGAHFRSQKQSAFREAPPYEQRELEPSTASYHPEGS